MVSRRGRREAGAGSRAFPGPRGSWGVVTREGELQPPPAQVSRERFCGEGGWCWRSPPGLLATVPYAPTRGSRTTWPPPLLARAIGS